MEVRIDIDQGSGFCFGVVNAISRAEELLASGEKVCCLGDIVHNRVEVQRLRQKGLDTISHDDLPRLEGCTVLIRAHGEPPSTYLTARREGLKVADATCPVVARLQKKVLRAYDMMKPVGGQVVILGKKGHAEVVGLTGQVEGDAIVVENMADLDSIDYSRPVYLLSQTTQSLSLFGQVRDGILSRSTRPDRVIIDDTICRQVASREVHLAAFASGFDTVVFVSGRKSSNGRVLFEVCRRANPSCRLVEDSDEIDPAWFEGVGSVGVCGATSTPGWLMKKVAAHINDICSNKTSK